MTHTKPAEPIVEITDQIGGTVRYTEHGTPNERICWHLHDDYELHLIVATKGKVFVGDYVGQFEPGQLILTGPRLPHNWITTSCQSAELRDMVLLFGPTVFQDSAQGLPELHELKPLLERAQSGIEFLGFNQREMMKRFKAIREANQLKRLILFFELMLELGQTHNYRVLSTTQFDSSASSCAQQKASTVIDYVMSHYNQPIVLSDVAKLVHMSDAYFSRFFRQTTGHRFVDLVNRVRISRACTLLIETDDNISTICYNVGFNNVANFNRRFHELKGVTPREYRKQTAMRQLG